MNPEMQVPARKQSRSAWKYRLGVVIVFACLVVVLKLFIFPGKESEKEERIPYAARSSVQQTRPASVAGQFYPGELSELYRVISQMMTNDPSVGLKGRRAVLVPHAGYVFSGDIAARSFREVDPNFRRVFILAANHNGEADFAGVSIPNVSHYAIPGAQVPLAALVDELLKDPLFLSEPKAHTMHMIELELPFLHYLRGAPPDVDFVIVPMVLGRMDAAQIGRLAELLSGYADGQTLFVFSVDLSHFYPDEQARKLDQFSVDAVLSMDTARLSKAVTDGNHVLMTLVQLAGHEGWDPDFLGYRNSGEVSGDLERVVGYASVVFGEPLSLTEEERRAFLAYARSVIQARVREGQTVDLEQAMLNRFPVFRVPRGVFVTLKKNGQLRGCIGDIVSNAPLFQGIQHCAINAATKDTRFKPVTPEELSQIVLSISILNYPQKVEVGRPEEYAQVIRPGKDGVILMCNGRQSTFLPSVWEEIPNPREFLSRLSMKQGSPPDAWLDPSTVLFRYGSYEFGEAD